MLRSTQTGAVISVLDAFVLAINEHPELAASVLPNQPPETVSFRMHYPDDESHFVIDTPLGFVRIGYIEFEGTLSIIETDPAGPSSGIPATRNVPPEMWAEMC
jgi:hypothetical protein